MDIMSDVDNLDVMLGSKNSNLIERELADTIEQSSVQGNIEANMHQRNDNRDITFENGLFRENDVRQYLETFSNEFNLKLSPRNGLHDVHDA